MSKLKYEIWLPKSKEQLESLLSQLLRTQNKHIIIRILNDYLNPEDLAGILQKFQRNIDQFRKNKSVVLLTDFYEQIPDYIPVAPTEEEAIDIIDFEEIERDLLLNEQ